MAMRVRLGKNVSIGKTGLRVGTRVGKLGYISTGASGTYIGAHVGPVRYSTFSSSGGRTASRGSSGPGSAAASYAAPNARYKRALHGVTAGPVAFLGTILLIVLASTTPYGWQFILIGPWVLWLLWKLVPKHDVWTYKAPTPTATAEIELDGVPVADTHRRLAGIADVATRIGRTPRARLISEPGNPNSPSSNAVRVEIGSDATVQEAGYLPEWAAAESTSQIRRNADQALDSVTNALIYGNVDDPRGLGVWLAGPNNPAITQEFTPTDLRHLGSKSIAVIIPVELATVAEPVASDLLLRLSPDPGVGVYYSDGRYLGELSDAQALSLRPRLEPLGTWFSIRGTSTVESGVLKVRVQVPKVGDLKKATANTR